MINSCEFDPIGRIAPCYPDGEVTTIDGDNKLAVCYCSHNPLGCAVDGRNVVFDILLPFAGSAKQQNHVQKGK